MPSTYMLQSFLSYYFLNRSKYFLHTMYKTRNLYMHLNEKSNALLKVFFFRKCDSFFKSPNLQISKKIFQKNYPELKFKFSAVTVFLAGNLNFKFRIVYWNIFFGDLKNRLHFLKIATFS